MISKKVLRMLRIEIVNGKKKKNGEDKPTNYTSMVFRLDVEVLRGTLEHICEELQWWKVTER